MSFAYPDGMILSERSFVVGGLTVYGTPIAPPSQPIAPPPTLPPPPHESVPLSLSNGTQLMNQKGDATGDYYKEVYDRVFLIVKGDLSLSSVGEGSKCGDSVAAGDIKCVPAGPTNSGLVAFEQTTCPGSYLNLSNRGGLKFLELDITTVTSKSAGVIFTVTHSED